MIRLFFGLIPIVAQALNYEVIPLVADTNIAPNVDPNLINPWGLFFVPNGNFWVADNGSDVSTLYQPNGEIINFVIKVPSATGAVINPFTNQFIIKSPMNSAPARFFFSSEDGTILGFNSSVDPTSAVVAVDNSLSGSVYKGLALGKTCCQTYLFTTDFFNRKIDLFDHSFVLHGIIKDYTIPKDFAPFNIKNINDFLYVTYAKQRPPENRDDDSGLGNGYVDIFSLTGNFIKRLISQGNLNSPWGIAVAPSNFGEFSGALLIGNFGDGMINAYNPFSGAFLGTLTDINNNPIVINGLWALEFDSKGTLYFSSGPNDEMNGLIGVIKPLP